MLWIKLPIAYELRKSGQMSSSKRAPDKREYNASGGETLTYREMVGRVRRQVRGPVLMLPGPLELSSPWPTG